VLRKRIAIPRPADTWELDGLHYFVFALHREREETDATVAHPAALFAMHPDGGEPQSVLVVTPVEGGFAEVRNPRHPDVVETVPL
jgi:hypothetical protein